MMGTPTHLLKCINGEDDAKEVKEDAKADVAETAHLPLTQDIAAEEVRSSLPRLNKPALSGLTVVVGYPCWYALYHSSSWLSWLH